MINKEVDLSKALRADLSLMIGGIIESSSKSNGTFNLEWTVLPGMRILAIPVKC